MRSYDSDAQDLRDLRRGLVEIPMCWLSVRDRETGGVVGIGLWRGRDAENIQVVDMFTGIQVTRTFYAGGFLDHSEIRYASGLNIHPVTLRLSSISNAVISAFREYEARNATAQIWARCYDPETWKPVAVEPRFKGYVNGAVFERPAPDGEAALEVELAPATRLLTEVSSRTKSHAAQRKRSSDAFRKYKGTTPQWAVAWGPGVE